MDKENKENENQILVDISTHPVVKEETILTEIVQALPIICYWCKDENCQISCVKLNQTMDHYRTCELKSEGGCVTCMNPIKICGAHAMTCTDQECSIAYIAYYTSCLREHQKLEESS